MDDTLGVFGNLALVGDHQDGPALVVELLEQVHYLRAGVGVEVAGRLVSEHQRGLVYQCAGDGDPLALAARQLCRVVVESVTQPDAGEQFLGPLAATHLDVLVEHHREGGVLGGGQPGHQIERLEDEADLRPAEPRPPRIRQLAHELSVDLHLPLVWRVQTAKQVHQCALPRPARSHHRGERPLRERERDPVECVDRLAEIVRSARVSCRNHRIGCLPL